MASVLRNATTLRAISSCSLLMPNQLCKTLSAGMISKAMRSEEIKRPPPFDYKNKTYGLITSLFDRTTWRFDENSKIVVVDGPLTAGKHKLAKQIAEDFDMLYIPHANLDHMLINPYGYDLRKVNDKLPHKLSCFDVADFLANPKDDRAALQQLNFFKIRLILYLDALSHLLNTGQGVVLNRSIYSDFVFLETHLKFGFLPQTLKRFYQLTWDCIRPDLLRPHLIIYLDTPADVVRQNLKKRNNPIEINSPVLQPQVLKEFEDVYKHQFLKNMSKYSELLVYDASQEVDPEVVVEDMEMVNLDKIEKESDKLGDWNIEKERKWNERRITYSRDREDLERWANHIPYYDCPEIFIGTEDLRGYDEVVSQLPGGKYAKGYNEDMGDGNILFKI